MAFDEADVQSLGAKIGSLDLTRAEQEALEFLCSRAIESDDDVRGFVTGPLQIQIMTPPVVADTTSTVEMQWFNELIANVSKARAEMGATVARNLRG